MARTFDERAKYALIFYAVERGDVRATLALALTHIAGIESLLVSNSDNY